MPGACIPAQLELAASFVNCSYLFKYEEKTDACETSASETTEPKNTAITRIPVARSAMEMRRKAATSLPRAVRVGD